MIPLLPMSRWTGPPPRPPQGAGAETESHGTKSTTPAGSTTASPEPPRFVAAVGPDGPPHQLQSAPRIPTYEPATTLIPSRFPTTLFSWKATFDTCPASPDAPAHTRRARKSPFRKSFVAIVTPSTPPPRNTELPKERVHEFPVITTPPALKRTTEPASSTNSLFVIAMLDWVPAGGEKPPANTMAADSSPVK